MVSFGVNFYKRNKKTDQKRDACFVRLSWNMKMRWLSLKLPNNRYSQNSNIFFTAKFTNEDFLVLGLVNLEIFVINRYHLIEAIPLVVKSFHIHFVKTLLFYWIKTLPWNVHGETIRNAEIALQMHRFFGILYNRNLKWPNDIRFHKQCVRNIWIAS